MPLQEQKEEQTNKIQDSPPLHVQQMYSVANLPPFMYRKMYLYTQEYTHLVQFCSVSTNYQCSQLNLLYNTTAKC